MRTCTYVCMCVRVSMYVHMIMCVCVCVCRTVCLFDFTCTYFQSVEKFVKILDTLSGWVDDIPPIDQPQRFGNKAFRQWHDKLKEVWSEIYFNLVLS